MMTPLFDLGLLLMHPPQVVEDFREVSGYDLVEPAHMELAEPSIATGEYVVPSTLCM